MVNKSRLPANVWLLTLIQSLAMSTGAMMVLVGGLLGAELAPSSELSTLPVALMIVGTAFGIVPVTRLMGKYGRKKVFVGISLLAAIGAVLGAFTSQIGSFYGFLGAAFTLGVAVSGFQQIRFAAMESVPILQAPKAASTVLLGGLVAAIVGPELVTLGRPLFDQAFTGAFVLMAGLCLVCALLFLAFKTKPEHTEHAPELAVQPVRKILNHPRFIVAVSSSVVGYALMSFIMTATPVHMHVMEDHSLEHTKWVIQSHIIAMFLPSLVSGWLISRIGVKNIIVTGLVIYLLTIAMAFAGTQLLNYWVALVLLGVGWNFLFLGGTVLLGQTHSPEQRYKVQGIHDFMVFTAQAFASLGAGAMLYTFGWKGLLLCSLLIIVLQVMVLFWQSVRNKKLLAPNSISQTVNNG